MAEYMDIARIDDWNDLSIIDDNGNATYVYDVGELPRADVIEREKIDKAIKEIKAESFNEARTYPERIDGSWCENIQIVNLQDVLEILKRNIGE